MDLWQAKRQIAYLLRQATWEDAPSDPVLTDAFVSEDLEGNFLPGDFLADGPVDKALPFARVARLGAAQDRESRGRVAELLLRAFVVAGGSGVAGAEGETATDEYDTHGENQVTGALRDPTDGPGSSTGRDVDEIVDRLIEDALGEGQLIDSVHGLQGEVVADLEADPVDGVQVLARPVDFVIYNATRTRYYHPGYNLAATHINEAHSYTLNSNNITNGDTFTIEASGDTYVFQCGVDFLRVAGGVSLTAANLRNAINADEDLSLLVTATSSGQFVTITNVAGSGVTLSCVSVGSLAFNTNGTIRVDWDLPPMRFDSLGGILRRGTNAGDAAPATETAGTDVPIGAFDDFVNAGYPGAGEWNFSYFMGYAETPQAQSAQVPDRISDRITATVTL